MEKLENEKISPSQSGFLTNSTGPGMMPPAMNLTASPMQAKMGGAPIQRVGDPASKEQVKSGMHELLQNWLIAGTQGATLFGTWALEKRIDDLESGSWVSFLQALLGNTMWASAAFVKVAKSAFALSMAGIAVASAPSIPSDVKGNVAAVQSAMFDYVNGIFASAETKRDTMADSLMAKYPGKDLNFLMNKWAEASFACVKIDPEGVAEPAIDLTATKDRMFIMGQLKFESMKGIDEIGPDSWGLAGSGEFLAYLQNSGGSKHAVVSTPAGGPGFQTVKVKSWVDPDLLDIAKKRHKDKWGVAVPTYELTSRTEARVVK